MFTIQHTFRSVVVFVAATIDRNLLNILTPSNRPRSVKRNASPAYCAPSERVLRVLLLFCSASRSVCYSNRSRLREPRLRLTLMDPNLFKFSVGERFSHDDFGAIRCTWSECDAMSIRVWEFPNRFRSRLTVGNEGCAEALSIGHFPSGSLSRWYHSNILKSSHGGMR